MNLNRRTFIGAATTWVVATPFVATSLPALSQSQGTDFVWVNDATPAGATLASDGGDAWNWTSANPTSYSGSRAHQSTLGAGEHQHYCYDATTTLAIATGDTCFAYV